MMIANVARCSCAMIRKRNQIDTKIATAQL